LLARLKLSTWGPVLALLLLSVGLSVANPRFLTLGNLQNIADQSAVALVLAVGITFVILLGAIDLSIEGVMAACSLTFALLVMNDRNDNELGLLAIVIAVGVGALFGLVNGLVNTKLKIPSFMVTLGTWSVGLGVGAVLFGGRPPRIRDMELRGLALDSWFGFSQLTYIAVAVVILGYIIQRYTRAGRYAYVIGGGEDVARMSGINVARYKTIIFVFAGSLMGLAAAMNSLRLGVGAVDVGAGRLFTTIAAVVIGGTLLSGGRGGVLHSVVGVLIMSVLANGMILTGVPSPIQRAVQGVIIVTAVVATTWPHRERLRVIK
jgi:ribose transport system permease protein